MKELITMLIPVWWLVIASLVTLIIGVGVGVAHERINQTLRRKEEMSRRLDYYNRRWRLVKGG